MRNILHKSDARLGIGWLHTSGSVYAYVFRQRSAGYINVKANGTSYHRSLAMSTTTVSPLHTLIRPCDLATLRPCDLATLQPWNLATPRPGLVPWTARLCRHRISTSGMGRPGRQAGLPTSSASTRRPLPPLVISRPPPWPSVPSSPPSDPPSPIQESL